MDRQGDTPVVNNEVSPKWVLNGNSDVRSESVSDLRCLYIHECAPTGQEP